MCMKSLPTVTDRIYSALCSVEESYHVLYQVLASKLNPQCSRCSVFRSAVCLHWTNFPISTIPPLSQLYLRVPDPSEPWPQNKARYPVMLSEGLPIPCSRPKNTIDLWGLSDQALMIFQWLSTCLMVDRSCNRHALVDSRRHPYYRPRHQLPSLTRFSVLTCIVSSHGLDISWSYSRVKGREIATSPTRKIGISSRKSSISTRYNSKTPNLSIIAAVKYPKLPLHQAPR